jgi:hypothetical protein
VWAQNKILLHIQGSIMIDFVLVSASMYVFRVRVLVSTPNDLFQLAFEFVSDPWF